MEPRERLARERPVTGDAYATMQRAARAAELRREPIDWTRPVPGWTLFDAVTP